MMTNESMIIIGIAVGLNVIIIKVKLDKKRYADSALDASILIVLSMLFKGTISGLVVATISSVLVSVYLWFSPPNINIEKWKKKLNI